MKLHHTSFFLSSALTLVSANAALIAYDGFGNGPRADLQGSTGGSGWNGPWTDIGSSQFTSVGGAGLTYANLLVTPGAAVTPSAGGAFDAADLAAALPAGLDSVSDLADALVADLLAALPPVAGAGAAALTLLAGSAFGLAAGFFAVMTILL